MPREFGRARCEWARRTVGTLDSNNWRGIEVSAYALVGRQAEADLAPAGQLDIDLDQQLRIEQRAMLDPLRAVDAIAGAERVEAVLGARVPGAPPVALSVRRRPRDP